MHRTVVRDTLGPAGVTYAATANLLLVVFLLSPWSSLGFFPTAFLLFLSNLFAIELCATAPQHPQHSGDDAPLAAVFTFLFTPFGGMFVLALEKADEEVQQKGYVVILLVAAFVAGAIKLCTSASRAERPFIQEVEEGRAGGSTDAPPGYAPIAADEQSTVPAK